MNSIRSGDIDTLLNTDWATDKWYSYVKYYNYNDPGYNEVARTFTRLVWKGSTQPQNPKDMKNKKFN